MKVLEACIVMFNIVMCFHFLKPFIEFATGGTWQKRISLVRQLLLVQYRVRLAVPGLIGLCASNIKHTLQEQEILQFTTAGTSLKRTLFPYDNIRLFWLFLTI